MVCSHVAAGRKKRLAPRETQTQDGAFLSSRDRQILDLIILGHSDRRIGLILRLSCKTVNYHVEKLKQRFAVGTRLQLVVACIACGVLPARIPGRDTMSHTPFVAASHDPNHCSDV